MASDAGNIEGVLNDILEELSAFPGIIGGVVVAAAGGIAHSFGAITAAMDRTTVAVNHLNALFERMFATAMSRQGGPLALPAHGNLKAEPVSPPGEGGGGVSALGTLAKAGAIAAAALGVLTIGVHFAEAQFQKLVGFVRLFNPGVVTMFQQAMANTGATIGRAFVPMIQNATEVVRQWAGILAPIMSQLAPVIKTVSDLLANTLMRGLTQLGAVIKSGIPIFKVFMEIFALVAEIGVTLFNVLGMLLRAVMLVARVFYELSGLGTGVRILTKLFEALNVVMRIFDEALSIIEVVVTSLVDSLMEWVAGLLGMEDVMESLNKAVEYVIRNMYVWAVMLAKMAGAMGVVDALIAHVEGKLKTTDVAAQQPQIKSLEQLSRDLALAAAAAGGAAGQGGVKNQQEFWQKTLEEMRAAKANGMSITDLIVEIRNLLRGMLLPWAGGTPAPPPAGSGSGPGGVAPPAGGGGAAIGGGVGAIVGGGVSGGLPGLLGGIGRVAGGAVGGFLR